MGYSALPDMQRNHITDIPSEHGKAIRFGTARRQVTGRHGRWCFISSIKPQDYKIQFTWRGFCILVCVTVAHGFDRIKTLKTRII